MSDPVLGVAQLNRAVDDALQEVRNCVRFVEESGQEDVGGRCVPLRGDGQPLQCAGKRVGDDKESRVLFLSVVQTAFTNCKPFRVPVRK